MADLPLPNPNVTAPPFVPTNTQTPMTLGVVDVARSIRLVLSIFETDPAEAVKLHASLKQIVADINARRKKTDV